jgi:hypothetical protein
MGLFLRILMGRSVAAALHNFVSRPVPGAWGYSLEFSVTPSVALHGVIPRNFS